MSEQYNAKNNGVTEEERQKQRGLWAAGIFTAVNAAFMLISIYAVIRQQGQFNIEDAILVPTTVILTISSLLGYFLIRQGRYKAGSELLFIVMMITPIMGTLLLSNIFWVAVAYSVIFSAVLYNWVLLKSSRLRARVALVLLALVLTGIELWNPGFRGVANETAAIAPFMIGLATVILLVSIVRQAWGTINLSIANRLTALVLVVTVPFLIALTAAITIQAGSQIEAQALHNLQQNNQSLATNVSTWLEQHVRTTKEMSMLPDITSMNAARQKATLKVIASAHPNLFLVHTTNTNGINVARNDDADLIDYNDRAWFLGAKGGAPITFEALISRTIGKPALNMSTPIYDRFGEIVGVASIVSELSEISKDVLDIEEGGGITYIVDANNRVVAHPDPTYTDGELRDLSAYPPVAALREGKIGQLIFTDENNVTWIAYADRLDNGWGIFAQQPQAELLAPVRQFQTTATILILIVSAIMSVLAWLTVRRSIQPIGALTTTVSAIAGGDLNRIAEVKSQDEIGVLASTFNLMTAQLREAFGTLEQRVADRTRNLELAAEVGRTVSQVRALDIMLTDAAELIRKQFDLYYVQVYLTDPSQTNLVLQAGTGAVGAELIGRGHRLPLTTASINGRAAIEKKSMVIADTAASAAFKPNPLLPATRSEMAVPLLIGDRVVGVLDMQSEHAGSLSDDGLPAFEALAGQLAIAIQNATILAEVEKARAEVESQSRRLTRANWAEYMDAIHQPEELGFVFKKNMLAPLTHEEPEQKEDAFVASIAVTGEALGNLVVEIEGQSPIARVEELVNTVARQISQQVENLRLLETAERYRFEAEESARRLTREGWEEYFNTKSDQSLSYLYDLKEVKAYQPGDSDISAAFSVPIKVGDETIGKLAVLGIESPDPEMLALVNAISGRLSEHVEGLRLLEETQLGQVELTKRARQLAAVSQISTLSSRELDIQKMLATVVQMTQRQFGLYHAHVFTYNEHAGHLEIAACGWQEGNEHEGSHETTIIPLDQEQSLVARAARSRQPVVINDVRAEPDWLPNPLLPGTASELAVPLVIGDEVLGVLDVQSDQRNAFSDEDINIQATLAAQVATALQNARSFSRAQRQAEREAMLNAISQKIQSATSVEAVLQIAARELGHALGAPRTIAQLSMKDNK
ncbi:MAG: GAF domain-containing protein [Anaerolineae bacterium]|nr:GAF domain-containing protein [Anaerolineae bacterium]